MKKFLKHFLLFLLLPLGLVILFFNTTLSLSLNESQEVYDVVSLAELGGIKTKTLLLGDSVCRLLFGEKKNERIYCLCENQSYEIPGNYLLLNSLLNNDSTFENLVLVVNPRTLVSSLNQDYTYNYFIKPFRNQLNNLDLKEIEYIDTTFPKDGMLKYKFSNFKLPNTFDIYQNDYRDSLNISDINLKYLKKIDSICKVNNIGFKLISPPLPSSNKEYIGKFTGKNKELLGPYFESVIYYDSSNSKDGLHHKDARLFVKEHTRELDSLLQF